MTTLRRSAQNVVDVWNRYGTVESLRGWMEILEAELKRPKPCDKCGKVTRDDDVHTCTPKPCPTCQALARAVMMDQTGYDMPPLRQLTDEVIADLWARNGTFHHHFARAIERWLKGQA